VSFANRARRADAPTIKGARAAPALGPPPSPRFVFSASADSLTDKAHVISAECNQWPSAFVGGASSQYCCDQKQPVTLVECKGANCAYRPLGATCPDVFADDGERLYFANDVRVAVLDRKDQKISTLSRRKRQPRAVTMSGEYIYWLEGEPISEIFRIKKDASDPTTAEMIARRQVDATEIAASDVALFWVARAPSDSANGSKHPGQKPKSRAPGSGPAHAAEAPSSLYVLPLLAARKQ